MSTRKSRLNTESPTPNSGSAESVASATTPTTPTARVKRSVRIKKPETSETALSAASINIKTEKIDDEEEAVKESIEDEEKTDTAKTDETKKEIVPGIAATRKRRMNTPKDEANAAVVAAAAAGGSTATVASSDTSSPSTTDDGKTSPNKVKRSRRSAIEILTGNKPIDTPRIGKRRNSTGKIEKPARKLSSRIKKLTQMRKVNLKRALQKKPDSKLTTTISRPPTKQADASKQASTAATTAASAKKGKADKNVDSASDSELLKISRRRSDSVSKCSDMTDTSSFQETKDADELPLSSVAEAVKSVEIKQESIDKDEEMATKTDSSEVATRSTNDSGVAADATDECKRPQYRLRRKPIAHPLPQKVMNTRSRSETPSKIETATVAGVTTAKNAVVADDAADETAVESLPTKEIKKENAGSPLHIETVADETTATQTVEEKAGTDQSCSSSVEAVASKSDGENFESLSPVLVSEGLSEISVKQFYGRPDFLENNLGIEKDPKLGDIVQVQEKIKSETADGSQSDNNEKPKTGQTVATDSETTAATVTEQVENSKSHVDNDAEESKGATATVDEEDGDEEEEIEEEEEEEDDDMESAEQEKMKPNANADDGNCFVKPIEQVRKNSTSLLNENLLLNGEIEVRPKEKKVAAKKADADVVLYTITTNGMRVNPEKLEKIIESQKQKEKDEQMAAANDERCVAHANGDSIDSNDAANKEPPIMLDGTTITKIEEPIEIEDSEPAPQQPSPAQASATITDEDEAMEQMEVDAAVESKENVDKTNQMAVETVPLTTSNKGSRSSSIEDETIEDLKQKESHLKTLGLLTHQAAVEATIEKQKRREQMKASIASSSTAGGKGKKNSSEYTGTLKTVIKLHRGGGSSSNESKKKGNLPLKMTLHKGRAKNGGTGSSSNDRSDPHSAANSEEDTYYTIQNQDFDGIDCNDALAEEQAAKEHEKLLVIPEKASSFRYHPEKLCEDQCFYCGGKFGLFDTPCHVAQIKSADRQKKILDNEEKLTVDSCLCDACFRHVDRRANCASYKKRLSAPPPTASLTEFETSATDADEKTLQQNPNATASEATLFQSNKEPIACLVAECTRQASHSLRRKWALKLRKTIAKSIAMNFDNTNSQAFLPICDKHCDDIGHMLVCVLCNRKLKTRHSYFINKDSNKVEPLLSAKGIPVVISSASVVCKMCHGYVNLLLKPQDVATSYVDKYTERLLEYYQKVDLVDDDSENDQLRRDQSEEPAAKRARVPKRGRKSSVDLSTPSSATNSDDGQSKHHKSNAELDASIESHHSRSERQRHKNKQQQMQQQQQQQKKLPPQILLAEQQRVEQRVQQEQLKLKQQELLQQQKQQEEIRQIQLRASNEDISNLRTNPNISMRELFPGEEEMGLNVSLPFSTSSWRTPDGWSKVTSTVQYDDPTRRLWEELQKPYGNQSSFLRHLILLEKYFRNGDLVLAPSANLNAVSYAESVQHRLQSYDNIAPRPISLTQLVGTAQATTSASATAAAKAFNVPNSAVTITKATTGSSSKSSSSATDAATNSLLKSNAPATNSSNQRRSYTMTTEPITNNSVGVDATTKSNNTSNSASGKSDASKPANSNANTNSTGTPKNNKSSIGLPPELICINTSTPNDKHQQQLLSQQLYQAQMQLTLQQHLQQQHQNSLLLTQQHKLQPIVQPATQVTPPKKTPSSATNLSAISAAPAPATTTNSTTKTPNVVRLPDTLTEAERRESKQWRPTLMPVSAAKSNSNNEVLYQTADGRRLPHLVQVQSSGKPYMISIHDYNRMCILRRERLLRDQEQMMKSKSNPSTSMPPTAINHNQQSKPSSTITSGLLATVVTSPPPSLTATISGVNDASAKKVQIPNKILEQNSLIPINAPKSMPIDSNADSLLKVRKNQSSLLKTNASNAILRPPKLAVPSPVSGHASVTATVVAPNTAKLPLSLTSALSQSNVVSITSTPSISAILAMNTGTPSSTPPPIQIVPQPITITSVSSLPMAVAQNSAQNNVSALEALFKTTNQVTTTPTTMWQWAEALNKSNSGTITPIDNSTKSILSKIPKSLTVIPQQKRLSSKGMDDN